MLTLAAQKVYPGKRAFIYVYHLPFVYKTKCTVMIEFDYSPVIDQVFIESFYHILEAQSCYLWFHYQYATIKLCI